MNANSMAILLAHGLLPVPVRECVADGDEAQQAALGTFVASLAYYGFAPALPALQRLRALDAHDLGELWTQLHPLVASLTGADRPMAEVIVYKNFPREVLALSEARYWLNQVLIYLGAPAEWLAEPPQQRPALDERLQLKVLALADEDALARIWRGLLTNPARWTRDQLEHARHLLRDLQVGRLGLDEFGFKENGIRLMADALPTGVAVSVADATDVLRLAAAMSGADVSLRQPVRFRSFTRAERRALLQMLEESTHLEADVALRKPLWKRVLARLHPGDYDVARVRRVYDALYNGRLEPTFNARVELALAARDRAVLELLQQRPGEFARRLRTLLSLFGDEAVAAFGTVADRLPTATLLRLHAYLRALPQRTHWLYAPRGNWHRVQLQEAVKDRTGERVLVTPSQRQALAAHIGRVLRKRLASRLPQGVALDARLAGVKLQTSGQQLAPYGRGTEFPLPSQARFVRTASYWEAPLHGSVWFDNGWSFFDEHWRPLGVCCWNTTHQMAPGAIFSGDPVSGADARGRGCQMIDLDIDELKRRGVRYAVWSILSYNGLAFSQAKDVLATLQWGQDALSGELYEPARAQIVFPLRGQDRVKYVAYLDLQRGVLVYLDLALRSSLRTAADNLDWLGRVMPACLQYLDSLPSVADLLQNAPVGALPALYSDDTVCIDSPRAYVFRPTNPASVYEPLDLQVLLAD